MTSDVLKEWPGWELYRVGTSGRVGDRVPDAVFDSALKHLSDRQLVELVGLVGYYWMLGRVATVFQVDLDVAQGTEVNDVGLQLAAHKLES